MNKKLLQSVREYKKQSIITPLLVTLEVLMEVLIPLEMAKIIDIGIAEGNLGYIIQRGLILVIMAMMSLFFGVQAGNFAAIAGAGYAKNLRHDIYYKVQDFSFKNIDHFSTSGLVTRMTTDITNIQMAYMMSIRLLARAPIMIVLSWIMTLTLSKKAALLFLIVIPVLGGTCCQWTDITSTKSARRSLPRTPRRSVLRSSLAARSWASAPKAPPARASRTRFRPTGSRSRRPVPTSPLR